MVMNIALFSWPIVVIILFRFLQRPQAVILSLICGYLLLPTRGGLDLPLLPALNKASIPSLAIFAVVLLAKPKAGDPAALQSWLPKGILPRIAFLALIFGSLLTILTNRDPLNYGSLVLPGLRLYDGFSAILLTVVQLLPLFLARKFLAHPEQQKTLLRILCMSGLIYSLLALYEVRMSPQLNQMIYGFFPHSWAQHFRNGGFRPIVFLSHGLQLAIFFVGSLMAAVALLRLSSGGNRTSHIFSALWLLMTLVLCKSLGALVIAVLLTPVIFFLSPRVQLSLAAIVVVLVISYPLSRGAGLVPVDQIASLATEYDATRGGSLNTRLVNEDRLLDKASERSSFGWGGWGRNRVYNEYGTDISITDGYWIIAISGGGWTRFLAEFLLLGAPVVLLAWRQRQNKVGTETAALAVIVAAWMLDLLPNSALTPPLWLIAGALWGRLELGRVSDEAGLDPVTAQSRTLVYTRMPNKFEERRPTKTRVSRYAHGLKS